jgi:hypothetical protein
MSLTSTSIAVAVLESVPRGQPYVAAIKDEVDAMKTAFNNLLLMTPYSIR